MQNVKLKYHIILALFIIQSTLSAQSVSESDDFSYALKLYNQEFYDLSAQQFIKYYNDYPNSARNDEAKYYAGMSLYLMEEFNQARIEFQSLALGFPKSPKAGESWFKIGECYEKLNNKEEAIKGYESIKILYPEHQFAPKGLYKAAVLHMELNQYERAAMNINTILDRYPASGEYYPAMAKAAWIRYLQGNVEQARIYLSKIISANPSPATMAETYLITAKIDKELGKVNDALTSLTKLIEEYSGSKFYIPAVMEYADIQIQLGVYDRAQQYLNRALSEELKPADQQTIRIHLGDVYFLNNKFALAEREYENLQHADCDSLGLILNLKQALSKRKQGLKKPSNAFLQNMLEECQGVDSPIKDRLFSILLSWLEETADYELAATLVNKKLLSTDSFENRIKLTTKLVHYYSKLSRWRELIREAQSMVRIQDKFAEKDDLVFQLATAYENIGDFDNSAFYYQQIVDQYASSVYFQEAKLKLEYLNDYRVINNSQTLSKITKLISRSFQNEDKGILQFELGKIYYSDLKDYKEAEQVLNQAQTLSSTNKGDVYLYSGKNYLKLAYQADISEIKQNEYLDLAKKNFTKAVENLSTCSAPDEASWHLVKTSVLYDTIPITKEKTYIEKLIKDYPNSNLLEDWYAELAFNLAFDTTYMKESIYYFERLEREFTNSSQYPTYLYGHAKLLQLKDTEEALARFKRIASEYPLSPEAAEAVNEVIRYYQDAGMFRETNQLYETLLSYYYYSELAEKARSQIQRIKLKAGKYDEAIDMIHQTLPSSFVSDPVLAAEFIKPGQFTDVFFLAEAYRAKGRYEEAREYYTMYLQTHEKGPLVDRTRLALGEYYYSKNQLNTALSHYLEVSPESAQAFLGAKKQIALIYFQLGDYTKAAEHYQNIINLSDDDEIKTRASAQLIICNIRNGNLSQGERLIKQFRRNFKDVNDFLAQFTIELGEYQRKNKQFSKAINYFSTVKKKYSKSSYVDDADYLLALTNITLNKHEEALKILSNFQNEYPASNRLAAVYNTLGTIYFRSEKYDAAIATFKKALELIDERSLEQQIMSNLIKAYTMTGFWDAAQGLSREYVEKYPFADDIIDKKIIIAQAFINLNQFQNGVEYLKKIKIEADSEREPEIQFYIGEALLKAGQYESAIAEFVKIPLLSKKTKLQWEASALYYAGQAYEKLGRIKDAIRMYNEIVNRPGIDLILKKDAAKRIKQIEG